MYSNDVLYNCLTDNNPPDWSLFDAIEIGGCIDASESEDETLIVGGISPSEAQFFSVYGHLKEGGVECFTDCDTLELAYLVAQYLGDKQNLPVYDHMLASG